MDFVGLRNGISIPTLTHKSDIELLQDGLQAADQQQTAAIETEDSVANYCPVPPKTLPASKRMPPKTPPASRKFCDGPPHVTNETGPFIFTNVEVIRNKRCNGV